MSTEETQSASATEEQPATDKSTGSKPTPPAATEMAPADGSDEGSPLVVGLVVLGVILVVLLGVIWLLNEAAPPIEEVRGKLYTALGQAEGVEEVERVGANRIRFANHGESWTLRVENMRVTEEGQGNLLVEVVPGEGREPFHANIFAEPGEEGWELVHNEEESGVERLWTRLERRILEGTLGTATDEDNPRVVIVTNKGDIELELWEDRYPNSVANFITLAEQGFYDGTKFHRIIDDFMIQGGDPNTREALIPGQAGTGGPGYAIPDEHDEGTVFDRAGLLAFANSGPNSSGSQFFITLSPRPHLDGQYNLFGEVVAGMDTVQRIAETPVSEGPRGEPSWPEEIVEVEEVEVLFKRDHPYHVERVD